MKPKRTGNPLARLCLPAALLCVVLLAGCKNGKPQHPQMRIPEVGVVTVKQEPVRLTTELPGRTSPFRIAEIRPQVSGLVQKRLFVEGSDIKIGQILYQIDPAPFQAALDNAKAALARAEANLPAIRARAGRFRKLLDIKAVSQQNYDDAVAALKQAQAEIEYWKAQVRSAAINLDYTKITAPIPGRIGRSSVTEGAIVTAYQPVPLATIQQLDPIYVDVPQSTVELQRLKRRLAEGRIKKDKKNANKVGIVLEDGSAYPLKGTLQFRDISVDPTTGSVILRIVVPNPNGVLLPGMFVRAVLEEGIKENAILVPQQSVMRDPKGNPFVMVVGADGKAAVRPLVLDRAIGDKWLVASGLAPGDRVIAEGLLMLRPGTPVKATPFAPTHAGHGPGPGASPEKQSKGGA